jgi:hypothetical protein
MKGRNWIEDEIKSIAEHLHLGDFEHGRQRYNQLRRKYELFPDKDKKKHYRKIKKLHDRISKR